MKFFIKKKIERQLEEHQKVNNYLKVQEIKVPDLKEYLVNGYEEIREVKKQLEETEKKLEEVSLYKIKYDGALVTLDEFKKRDDINKKSIDNLKDKIQEKDDEIYKINSILNNYKIQEKELTKNYQELREKIKSELISEFENRINNTKGTLSKSKIINLLEE